MTDVAELLGQIAQGYQTAHPESLPTEPGVTWAGDAAGRGQPRSKPPPGSSVYVRGQLVDAARLVLDVHWKAGGPRRPRWPGFGARNVGFRPGVHQQHAEEPDSTAETAHEYDATVAEKDRQCETCRGSGETRGEVCDGCDGTGSYTRYGDVLRVAWRPIWAPDQHDVILTPPSPRNMRDACKAAQGRLAAVWDPDATYVLTQLTQLAYLAVVRAGGDEEGARRIQWRNIQELQDQLCGRCGKPTEVGKRVHGNCKACDNQLRYRERRRLGQAASA